MALNHLNTKPQNQNNQSPKNEIVTFETLYGMPTSNPYGPMPVPLMNSKIELTISNSLKELLAPIFTKLSQTQGVLHIPAFTMLVDYNPLSADGDEFRISGNLFHNPMVVQMLLGCLVTLFEKAENPVKGDLCFINTHEYETGKTKHYSHFIDGVLVESYDEQYQRRNLIASQPLGV